MNIIPKPRIRKSRWGTIWVCAVQGDPPIRFAIGITPAEAYNNWLAVRLLRSG